MEFIKLQNEYSWVIEVLESCNTEPQVMTTNNLFKQFIKKWSDEISDERKIRLVHGFNRLMGDKILNIRKNHSQTI
jgi:hypothetical protein